MTFGWWNPPSGPTPDELIDSTQVTQEDPNLLITQEDLGDCNKKISPANRFIAETIFDECRYRPEDDLGH